VQERKKQNENIINVIIDLQNKDGKNIAMTLPTSNKQYRRRSSCGAIDIIAANAAMTSSNPAFTTCHNYHGSVISQGPSSTFLPPSLFMGRSRCPTMFDQPLNLTDNPSMVKHLNANNKRSWQEDKKKNMDVDEWALKLHDDKTKKLDRRCSI